LLDGFEVLKEVSDYAVTNGIEHIIFLGDIHHLHDRMLNAVASGLYSWAINCRDLSRKVYFLVGNHDLDFDCRYHCLDPFRSFFTVVDQSMSVEIDGWDLAFIPWRLGDVFERDLEGALRLHDPDVLFLHHDFKDVKYRERDIGRCGSIKAIPKDTLTISGHYHDYIQVNDHVYYIGAPMQHDWGDRGQKRGMYELTLKPNRKHELRYIRTHYPKFRRIVDTLALEKDVHWFDDNFIQIWRTDVKTAKKAAARVRAHARCIDVVNAEDSIANVILKAGMAPKGPVRFDPFDVIEAAIKDAETDLNKWLLKRIGGKAMRKALTRDK